VRAAPGLVEVTLKNNMSCPRYNPSPNGLAKKRERIVLSKTLSPQKV